MATKAITVSTKKKQTHRDRGYVTRREAGHALRRLAADLEAPTDGCLVKLSINLWLASEDQPEVRDGAK